MKKELSVYLDILRVLAAAAVFLSHLSWLEISGGFLWQLQPYGHPAVIVFFVLSGYLIQYSVAARENRLADYAVARLGRLYSVVIPALILTYIFDRIGASHNP
ncbi:MAG TPA: acyltransferase family protein, partial [Rhizomicrobium sp.]|nr:acyltransferase family protein [Rhizomicrobium sp.]